MITLFSNEENDINLQMELSFVLFHCHRIPKEDADELVHYEHTENEVCVDALITPQNG